MGFVMRSMDASVVENSAVQARSRVYIELLKPRITAMVLLTVAIGWLLGTAGTIDPVVLLHVLVGAGCSCAGAGALNQYIERDSDGSMDRTRFRPLPTRRVSPSSALILGVGAATGGIVYLAVLVNTVAALIDACTLVSYLFVYTPMKKMSAYSTLAGAVPGALPPVIGWAAATGGVGLHAWVLFSILFLWQIPHFLAIGILYKRDYARGGFPMLVVIDEEGGLTGRQMVLYAAALIPISLMVSLVGLTGAVYFWSALLLGAVYLAYSVLAALRMDADSARRLLLCSVAYLPLLLAVMVLDRIAIG